jgi:hypothetical protein
MRPVRGITKRCSRRRAIPVFLSRDYLFDVNRELWPMKARVPRISRTSPLGATPIRSTWTLSTLLR